MNNILKYAIALATIAMVSCEPLDEVYTELDKNAAAEKTNEVSAELDFKLEEADYELLEGVEGAENIVRFKNFSSEDDAKSFLPTILELKYPHLGAGSFAKTTYDYYRGSNSDARMYSNADMYELSADDYYAIDSAAGEYEFLNATFSSEAEVSATLLANIANAEDGDVILASFEYADIDYSSITGATVLSNEFNAASDFTYSTESLNGAEVWEWDSFSGNGYAGMSGYAGGNNPNEDWLILPVADLSGYTDAVLNINQTLNFLGTGEIGKDIAVMVSEDYTGTGSVANATWVNLEANVWPDGDNWTPVDSEFNLNAYVGKEVYIAFKYISTADYAPNWQISSLSIEAGEPISTISIEEFYAYSSADAEWSKVDVGVYYLQSADYDKMGAPGTYNNFSSSAEPEDYLPTLLNELYPYAQNEDEVVMVYKYYDGGVERRATHYTYNGEWVAYQSVVEAKLSLGHDGDTWVPDNTIKVELSASDYVIIQGLEGGDRGDNVAQFNSFYQGSNTTGGTYWANDEILEILISFLNDQYTTADVGQKYLLVYDVYVGGGTTETRETKFIKDASGEYILYTED